MCHPNPLGNAVRVGDGKADFLEALADWLCLVSMKLKSLNRLLIRVAKKFPLLLRVTSPKNWQIGLIATVVNRYLLQVQWTWQKTIT